MLNVENTQFMQKFPAFACICGSVDEKLLLKHWFRYFVTLSYFTVNKYTSSFNLLHMLGILSCCLKFFDTDVLCINIGKKLHSRHVDIFCLVVQYAQRVY